MKTAAFRKVAAICLTIMMLLTCLSSQATDETTTQIVTSGHDETVDGAVIITVTTNADADGVIVDATGGADASLTVTNFVSAEREAPAAPYYEAEAAQVNTEYGNEAKLTVEKAIEAETSVNNSPATAVEASAEDADSRAVVEAGSISAETEGNQSKATAVNAQADDSGSVTVNTESISAETEGNQSQATAVSIEAEDEGNVEVKADVITAKTEGNSSSANAVIAYAEDGGSITLQAGTVSAETEGNVSAPDAMNLKTKNGTIKATVEDEVTATAENGSPRAILAETSGEKSDIDVTVGGVSAQGKTGISAVELRGQGGSVSVEVEQDVSSSGNGILIRDITAKSSDMTAAEGSAVAGKGNKNNSWTNGSDIYEHYNYIDENGVEYGYTMKNGIFDYGRKAEPYEKATNYTVNVNGVVAAEGDGNNPIYGIIENLQASGDTSSVSAAGISADAKSNTSAYAVSLENDEDTELTLTVGDQGITATAEGKNSGNAYGIYTSVHGTQTINVNGDITATSSSEFGGAHAISANVNETGSLTVHVGGGLNATTSSETSRGVGAQLTMTGGTAELTIEGDVTADMGGIIVSNNRISQNNPMTSAEAATLLSGDFAKNNKPSEMTVLIGGVMTPVLQYSGYTDDGAYCNFATLDDGTFVIGSITEYSYPEASATIQVDGKIVVNGRGENSTAGVSITSWNENAQTQMTVNGDVSVSGDDDVNGVRANANSGIITVKAGGDISAISKSSNAVGLVATAGENSQTTVTVEGGIVTKTETEELYSAATGLSASTFAADSKVTVTVGEGIEADNTAAEEKAIGAYLRNETDNEHKAGLINIQVTGDITSTGTGIKISGSERDYIEGEPEIKESEYVNSKFMTAVDGKTVVEEKIYYNAEDDCYYNDSGNMWKTAEVESGLTQIEVRGDVTGGDVGLDVTGEVPAEVVIDGTLEGGNHAVVLREESVVDNLTLTVWEIKPNEDGSVAETGLMNEDGGLDTEEYEDFEKQIQYIIRLEQPEAGGTISTEGTSKYNEFDVAHEGDSVVLKVNLEPGYEIVDAYNGTDTKVSLLQDADGNYYLVVPRGGGVLLSVKLQKIVPKKDDEPVMQEKAVKQTETVGYKQETAPSVQQADPKPDGTTGAKKSAGTVKTEKAVEQRSEKITVTIDPNGGLLLGSTDSIVRNVNRDTEMLLPEAPVKDGEVFLGWYVTAYPATDSRWTAPEEGSAELLKAGGSVKVTEDCFITAVWKQEE